MEVLPWPPQSPDLRPIENLWGYLKDKLNQVEVHSMVELDAAVHREWAAAPVDYLDKLINLMPQHLQAVVAIGSCHTKY